MFSGKRERTSSKEVDHGNLAEVSAVGALKEFLSKQRDDIAEELLDGLILDNGVLGGDGSLENADALRILVENGLDILGSPE